MISNYKIIIKKYEIVNKYQVINIKYLNILNTS